MPDKTEVATQRRRADMFDLIAGTVFLFAFLAVVKVFVYAAEMQANAEKQAGRQQAWRLDKVRSLDRLEAVLDDPGAGSDEFRRAAEDVERLFGNRIRIDCVVDESDGRNTEPKRKGTRSE